MGIYGYTRNMETDSKSGFREIEHTADRELEIWGPDLETMFAQAVHGMLSLMGLRLVPGNESAYWQENSNMHDQSQSAQLTRRITLVAEDKESLLVSFLSEILYLFEGEGLGFASFNLTIQDDSLICDAILAPVQEVEKEIKAVTFHNLSIRQTPNGCRARLVFDV